MLALRLYGEYSHTPGIHLHRPGAFHRGSQEQLLVAAEMDLGKLCKIQIWHDNTGLSPDWYLSRGGHQRAAEPSQEVLLPSG